MCPMKNPDWSKINKGGIFYRCSPEHRDEINEACRVHDMSQKGFMARAVRELLEKLRREKP